MAGLMMPQLAPMAAQTAQANPPVGVPRVNPLMPAGYQSLAPGQQEALQSRGLLMTGLGMLGGQNIGQAGMAGISSMDQMMNAYTQNRMREYQMGQMERAQKTQSALDTSLEAQRPALEKQYGKEMADLMINSAMSTGSSSGITNALVGGGGNVKVEVMQGVPVMTVRDKQGNLIKAQPISNPFFGLGGGGGLNLGLGDELPPGQEQQPEPPKTLAEMEAYQAQQEAARRAAQQARESYAQGVIWFDRLPGEIDAMDKSQAEQALRQLDEIFPLLQGGRREMAVRYKQRLESIVSG